jgi:hypothetical protein
MFEIYDFTTGEIVRKTNNPERAYDIAQALTQDYAWVNGHTFDYRAS